MQVFQEGLLEGEHERPGTARHREGQRKRPWNSKKNSKMKFRKGGGLVGDPRRSEMADEKQYFNNCGSKSDTLLEVRDFYIFYLHFRQVLSKIAYRLEEYRRYRTMPRR